MNPHLVLGLPGLAVVLWYVARRRAGREPLGDWPTGDFPDTTMALIGGMAAYLFAQGFLPGLLAGTDLRRDGGPALGAFAAALVNGLIAAMLLPSALRGTRRPDLSSGRILAAGALAALVVCSAQVVLGFVIESVAELVDFEILVQSVVESAQRASGAEVVTHAAAAIVIAPFAEEVFFRGVMLPAFARVMDGRAAILLQAVCFGAIHIGSWNAWPLAIPLAVVGWAAGWIYVRTGSLGAPIALHAVFNAINFALIRSV